MKRLLGLTVAFLLITSLAGAADDKSTPLYPLKENNKWIYKVSSGTVEVKVVKKEKFADEECYKLETSAQGKVTTTEHVVVREDGVYRLGINGVKVEPAIKFLALPPTKNFKWEIKSKVDKQDIEGYFQIKEEDVTVPAGPYKASTLVDTNNFKVAGKDSTVKAWFVKDVGIVKLTFSLEGQEATFELEKFEAGK